MKRIVYILALILIFSACKKTTEISSYNSPDWDSRMTNIENPEVLTFGKSYLPVYSHIYQVHENETFDLTVTASIRNVSPKDTLYILSAEYYNTNGELVRNYFKHPIFIAPLETIEIVVDEADSEGGSGAKFLFEWATKNEKNPPLFEGVMISTLAQQGLSFTTRGIQIYD